LLARGLVGPRSGSYGGGGMRRRAAVESKCGCGADSKPSARYEVEPTYIHRLTDKYRWVVLVSLDPNMFIGEPTSPMNIDHSIFVGNVASPTNIWGGSKSNWTPYICWCPAQTDEFNLYLSV
jgi:hypothetical protein